MRSCYHVRMSFDPTNLSAVTPCTWFYVPKGTPALGYETPFGSSIWDDGYWPNELGEDSKSRVWWRGGPPLRVPLGPPGRCGTAAQWLHGVPPGTPPNPINALTGIGLCCGPSVAMEYPGEAYGVSFQSEHHILQHPGIAYGGDQLIGITYPAKPGVSYGARANLKVGMQQIGGEILGLKGFENFPTVPMPGEDYASGMLLKVKTIQTGGNKMAANVLLKVKYLSTGGESYGANQTVTPAQLVSPGETYGAAMVLVQVILAGGGESYGATGSAIALITAKPGEKYGANAGDPDVTTPCCAQSMARTQTATFSGYSGALAFMNGASAALAFNFTVKNWQGTLSAGGHSTTLLLGCSGLIMPGFTLSSTGGDLSVNSFSAPTGTCGRPSNLAFTGVQVGSGINFGNGNVSITST
jgi:hypothetical protein